MSNKYDQKHKEKLQREAHEKYRNLPNEKTKTKRKQKKVQGRYQNFTEEDKEKKCQYYCDSSKILSREQKQKLVEYRRNYYISHNK